MSTVKNVLVLTGPMGSGHIRAAEAVCDHFRAVRPDITMHCIETSVWMPRAVRWIFCTLYPWVLQRAPGIWRHIHHFNNTSHRGFFVLFFDATSGKMERRILEFVQKNAIDLVIATHFYPARILDKLKRSGILHVPCTAVVTDHTAHRIYCNDALDLVFVPNDLSLSRMREWGMPAEKLAVAACPVFDVFHRPVSAGEIELFRKEIGCDPRMPYLLLTLGGWCIGHMKKLVRQLLKLHNGYGICVMTGNNRALFNSLRKKAARSRKRLLVFPYTHEMYKFMAISNFVVTKPGGITTTECIALKKPMLLVDPIPGHEEKNLKYLVERGVAIAVGTGENIASAIARMPVEIPRLHHNMRTLDGQFVPGVRAILEKSLPLVREVPENAPRTSAPASFWRRLALLKNPVALFLLLLTLAGCAPALTPEINCHIIAADGNGHPLFFDLTNENGETIREADDITLEEHLADMEKSLEKSGRKKVMIYCFGGMNPVNETVEISAENTPVIMRDADVYPLFVNWESELFDCYANHLLLVRQGMENYWTGPPTVPFYFIADICNTFCKLPLHMCYQTKALWESADQESYKQVSRVLSRSDDAMECHLGNDYASHAWMPVVRLGFFAGTPFRFLTTPLIDVFGSRAWEEMHRRVHLAFVRDPENSDDSGNSPDTLEDGVFSRFTEMLISYSKKHPDTEITLIGHCMGSFIVTEILSRYPQLPVKNIVFMAAASSVHDTALSVKPYLQTHPDAHFYNLCLHPFIDRYDMMDYCVLPCGSVLTWVDQYLATTVSKEDYTVGVWDTCFLQLPKCMRGVEKQVTIKAFGILDPENGLSTPDIPSQHTDFSSLDAKFWRPEFWQIPASRK